LLTAAGVATFATAPHVIAPRVAADVAPAGEHLRPAL